MAKPIYSDVLPGGKHWSLILQRDMRLCLTDIEGGANVGMLFYNPVNLVERYNAPDTLKCQHTFKLTAGHCLYSDMGRVFCSIVADDIGWHDTVTGNTTKAMVAKRWGETSFQTHRNAWQQNGFDSFLIEAAKYGMDRRDLSMNVNWFSKVAVSEDGRLHLDTTARRKGARVELRFEMTTLVLMHTCPHPLDTAPIYPAKPVRYEIIEGEPHGLDDLCLNSAPENARGLENNRLFNAGCC